MSRRSSACCAETDVDGCPCKPAAVRRTAAMKSRRQVSVRVDEGCLSACCACKEMLHGARHVLSANVKSSPRMPRTCCEDHFCLESLCYLSSSPSVLIQPSIHRVCRLDDPRPTRGMVIKKHR